MVNSDCVFPAISTPLETTASVMVTAGVCGSALTKRNWLFSDNDDSAPGGNEPRRLISNSAIFRDVPAMLRYSGDNAEVREIGGIDGVMNVVAS